MVNVNRYWALQPVAAATRKTLVTERIREAIFSGRIALGTPLRELHLARELNVSQPTVREALLELENAGFVIRKPNSGTTVTALSIEEVRQRVEVRLTLEEMAGQKAATLVSSEELKDLREKLATISDCIARNDYYQAAQADLAFHRVVWTASRNEVLVKALEQITGPLLAFLSVVRSHGVQNLSEAMLSHEPIVAALEIHSPVKAASALRAHIWGSYEPFLKSGYENCTELIESLKTAARGDR